MEFIEDLLGVLKSHDYGMSKLELFEYWIQRNENLSIKWVKEKLLKSLDDPTINWTEVALKTEFVYSPDNFQRRSLTVDDLLIFTDSFPWKDAVIQKEIAPSTYEKDEIKELFREVQIFDYEGIHDLIDSHNFDEVPFEIKHAYKSNFASLSYTDQDIIYYLKKIVWEYLFPNSYNEERLDSINKSTVQILEGCKEDEGWIEADKIVNDLQGNFPNLDLFELSSANWQTNVQRKGHYRNPFTLGFLRALS